MSPLPYAMILWPVWPGGLPLLFSLLVLALMVDLVERFLEQIGKSICGWERVPPDKARDLWVTAALLVLALSIPGLGLGSVFSLAIILLILDIASQREREREE